MTKRKEHTRTYSAFTPQECALISLLATGRFATREAMISAVYGHRIDGGPDSIIRCLNVLFHRVRTELAKRGIVIPQRVRHVPYRLDIETAKAVRAVIAGQTNVSTKQYVVATLREAIAVIEETHAQ